MKRHACKKCNGFMWSVVSEKDKFFLRCFFCGRLTEVDNIQMFREAKK